MELPRRKKPAQAKAQLLGIGLDKEEDGPTRITRGKNFQLYGGSQETHERMQETAIKVNEQLDKRGKRLEDVSIREFRDLLEEASG